MSAAGATKRYNANVSPGTMRGIAKLLQVSETQVRAWQRCGDDPMPVVHGRVDAEALRAWATRRMACTAAAAVLRLEAAAPLEHRHVLYEPGVYVVSYQDCDRVKIGFASDLTERIDCLDTGFPYPAQILAFIPGPQSLELEIHKYLQAHRRHKEWFEANEEVLKTIGWLVKSFGGVML